MLVLWNVELSFHLWARPRHKRTIFADSDIFSCSGTRRHLVAGFQDDGRPSRQEQWRNVGSSSATNDMLSSRTVRMFQVFPCWDSTRRRYGTQPACVGRMVGYRQIRLAVIGTWYLLGCDFPNLWFKSVQSSAMHLSRQKQEQGRASKSIGNLDV